VAREPRWQGGPIWGGGVEGSELIGVGLSTAAQVGEGGTTGEVTDEVSPVVLDVLGSLNGPVPSLRKRRCGRRTMDSGSRR
jgi:hypothetical protein